MHVTAYGCKRVCQGLIILQARTAVMLRDGVVRPLPPEQAHPFVEDRGLGSRTGASGHQVRLCSIRLTSATAGLPHQKRTVEPKCWRR